MKKLSAILLCLLLVLTVGCAKREPASTTGSTAQLTTAPTEAATSPTEPPPQTEEATILADQVPAVLAILSRGDSVDVVGEYDETHYVIETDLGYGLVEKRLLATPDSEPYETWMGYSRWNRNIYDNHRLSGTPIQVLQTNTKIEVLDDLGNCCVVKVEDILGFMKLEDISKNPIRSQSGGNDGDGGNSSGGSSGDDSSGGQDGGDISLQYNGGIVFLSSITQEGTVTGQATVRADGTEVVLGYYDRGDTAQVVMESGFAKDWEGYATVMMDGLYAHVSEALIQRKDEEAYVQWDGYAKYMTMFYDNFYLQGEGKQLSANTAIHVVAELETCYLVTVDEEFGYVAKDFVSEKKIVGKTAPSESGGGGSSGDGQEWSDPVL